VPLPGLVGLEVAGGPSVSTQMSMVNGQVSQSRSYTWMLRPTAAGKARIAPLELELEGETLATDPIEIEVVEGSVRPRADPRRRMDPFADLFDSPFRRRQRREPRVAMRAIPDPARVHVGEPVLLTYWLYTQVNPTDWNIDGEYPGFWAERLEREQDIRGERTTLEGEAAVRYPVERRLLFPTRAGELAIPEARARIALQPQGFFGDRAVVERTVTPVTIRVDPLPEAPDFTGAVGDFHASASVDRSDLPLGEAATLRFRVEGTGNLKWLEQPPEFEVPGARLYPPQVKSDVEVGPEGARGSKTWEFVVVPETAGALEIPAIPFAWFDPKTDALRRTETAPILLNVSGGEGASAPVATAGAGSRDRGLPLRADLGGASEGLRVSARALAMALALGLGLHALLWLGPRISEVRRRAAGRHTPARSIRGALAELKRAGQGNLTKEASASAIEKALHDVFGSLDGGPDEGEREREARSLLERVQFVRYAPQLGDYSQELRELAAEARALVKRA